MTKITTIILTQEQNEKLVELSKKEERGKSWFIRKALDRYLEDEHTE